MRNNLVLWEFSFRDHLSLLNHLISSIPVFLIEALIRDNISIVQIYAHVLQIFIDLI